MKPIRVMVSGCAMRVGGADKETLFCLWQATKDLKFPYRITKAPKTGDADLYLIEEAA